MRLSRFLLSWAVLPNPGQFYLVRPTTGPRNPHLTKRARPAEQTPTGSQNRKVLLMNLVPVKQPNLDAVEHLVSYWTRRLKIDVGDAGVDTPNASLALCMATIALVGDRDMREARPEVYIGDAIAAGVRIALDVLADPLGDPRKHIMEHLSWLECDIKCDAKRVRQEAVWTAERAKKGANAQVPALANGHP